MALTREFVEAVSQGNLLRVKIMLKDSLLVDTSFEQFNEMINYAEPRISGIWISDDDDEAFSQNPICGRISSRNQMDTKDIQELRAAAMRIVNHCDNITRK